MRNILLAWIFLATQLSYAQTIGRVINYNSAESADYSTNYVVSSSAKLNASNCTTSNATCSQDTSTSLIDNKASYACDTSSTGGYCEFGLSTVYNPALSGNCQFSGVYAGTDVSLYAAQITDGSGTNLANTVNFQNTSSATDFRAFSVFYPCAASGSRKIRIYQATAGTTSSIAIGKLYYGSPTILGAGVPTNVFSVKVATVCTSTPCTITSMTGGNWLSSVSRASAGNYSLNFPSGYFTVAPVCQVRPGNVSFGMIQALAQAIPTSTTVYSFITNVSGGAANDSGFDVTCTRAGSDFIQSTITPQNFDYDWTSYTPTFTGFGTVTSVECQEKREGSDNLIRCKFTAGTTTATEARISLRSGLTSADSSIIPTIQLAGYMTFGFNSASAPTVLIEPSVTYVTLGSQATGAAGLTKVNGNTYSTGNVLSFFARVPISGWGVTQNAPQLVGSITNNSTNAWRQESANITCSSSSAINNNSSTWATIGNISSGRCTVTFSGFAPANANYYCGFMPQGTSVTSITGFSINNKSTSAFDLYFSLISSGSSTIAAATTVTGDLTCWFPR